MKLKKHLIIILGFAVAALVCAVVIFANGVGDKQSAGAGAGAGEIVLTGRVRLVGNMPFPEFVISEESGGDWHVVAEEMDKFKGLEHQTVTVSASYRIVDMILADGKKIGVRRILNNITIVKGS
jgi:hypothetical protein